MIEAQVINLLVIKNDSILDATGLVTAYNFKFSNAFLLILSLAMMIGNTTNLYSNKFVFKVIEMEFGFSYDVL